MHELIPHKFPASDVQYDIPDLNNPYMKQKTMTEIKNAWNRYASIDNYGRVWVDEKGFRSILRVDTHHAKYYAGSINDEYKYEDKGTFFIKGEAVLSLLDQRLQSAGNASKENYLRYSELFYRAIRDCEFAKNIRNEFYCYIDKIKPQLKTKRIKAYSITYDELTNEELDLRECQFSHVRSAAIYPVFATHIDSGLIVNKEIHDIITNYGIGDENQLYSLCIENKWSTDWYDKYIAIFGKLYD